MCANCADEAFAALLERLRAARSILLLTHARPDGDALGCVAALASAARRSGRRAEVFVPNEIPRRYAFLFEAGPSVGAPDLDRLADEAELILVADTCAFRQLDGLEGLLRAHRNKVAVIDHHLTRDDVGSLVWSDTTAAAAGIMVAELLKALAWPVSPEIAEALLVAITSDTGWFRFSNTDARALRVAAGLLEVGASLDRTFRRLFQTDRIERLRLLERMLASLRLHCDGRLALMTLRKGDFDDTGATEDETENLINEALRLNSVEVVVLLVESAEGVRASLRSRAVVDVADVACGFGGGGHARAAGFRAAENIDTLAQQVISAVAEALR